MKKKENTPQCKNCRLFNRTKRTCGVAILYEGEQRHLPVEAEDTCFFEGKFTAINDNGEIEAFKPEVQQVRWWVEDADGNPTNGNGTVKIEYPEGFFGDPTI